jgi:MarR family transcriptional regulator for hemolysin
MLAAMNDGAMNQEEGRPSPVGGDGAEAGCGEDPGRKRRVAVPSEPDLEKNFGFLVHDVARLMRTVYDRRTRALGLTRSQWWVLNHLYVNDGISQTELADILDVEKPSLGRLLDRLEGADWIERRPDAADRRVKRIHLTPRVAPLVRELRAIAGELRAEALEGLDPAERERLLGTLLLIKENLLRMNANGAPVGLVAEGVDG